MLFSNFQLQTKIWMHNNVVRCLHEMSLHVCWNFRISGTAAFMVGTFQRVYYLLGLLKCRRGLFVWFIEWCSLRRRVEERKEEF